MAVTARTFNPIDLIPLWRKALEEEIGIAIATDDKLHLKAQLYEARKLAEDDRLDDIVLCTPLGDELFLVKKATTLD